MQILRTRGTKYQGWGGYLNCMIHTPYLPPLMFRYMPKNSIKSLTYIDRDLIVLPKSHSDLPIGMSADTCIQYWDDL